MQSHQKVASMADRGHALSASGSDTGTCSVDVAKLHFIFEETCLHVVVAPQHPCRLPFMRCTYSERLTYQIFFPINDIITNAP